MKIMFCLQEYKIGESQMDSLRSVAKKLKQNLISGKATNLKKEILPLLMVWVMVRVFLFTLPYLYMAQW